MTKIILLLTLLLFLLTAKTNAQSKHRKTATSSAQKKGSTKVGGKFKKI